MATKRELKEKNRRSMTAYRQRLRKGGRVLVATFPLSKTVRNSVAQMAKARGISMPEMVSELVTRAVRGMKGK